MDYIKMGEYLYAHIVKKCNLNSENIVNIQTYLNSKDILNDEVKTYILDLINKMPRYNKETAINYLVELYKLNNNDSITKYLEETDIKEIYLFFDENEYFRDGLINNYFSCIKNNKHIIKEEPETKVEFLPDILRKAYEFITNAMHNDGVELFNIADIMYDIFTLNGKVIAEDKEILDNFNLLLSYKKVFFRIMFSDLYLLFKKENTDGSFDVEIAYIKECNEKVEYYLPQNEQLAKELFEIYIHYVELNDDRIDNKKSASEEDRKLYNSINFLNPIEDINTARG